MIQNQSVSTANNVRSNTPSAPITVANSDKNKIVNLPIPEPLHTPITIDATDLTQIYKDLPPILKEGVETLLDANAKETFMFSAIGCASAVLPNIYGKYDGKTIFPTLYVYILGAAGAGKSGMGYAKSLVTPIHLAIKNNSPKDDDGNTIASKEQRLFFNANSSTSALLKTLSATDGKGLMLESEGDTLANTLKSDFGDFSAFLRANFHHESYGQSRVDTANNVCLEKPRLSLVVTSTFEQFLSLCPSAENGLFSRMMLCEIKSVDTWLNPFDPNKRKYEATFEQLANSLLIKYGELLRSQDIEFRFTHEQIIRFNEMFAYWKKDTRFVLESDGLDATIHRLGLIMFRISMIFSVLRSDLNVIDTIECIDIDFENAFKIVEKCKNKAFEVFQRLQSKSAKSEKFAAKSEQMQKAIELKAQGVSLREIALQVLGDEKKKPLIQYWTKASAV